MTATAQTSADSTTMEVTDDVLEAMVTKASRPTLAQLFEQGKETGVIKPVAEYSAAATGS